MPEDRRYPIQPFDPALITDFLSERSVVSSLFLSGGKCSSNYKLLLSTGETFVLRLRSRGDAARESYVMDLVRDLVPVPVEVDRGDGWSVYLFVEGHRLSDDPELVGKAAEALARISSVRFPSGGWINPGGTITPFDFGDGRDFTTAMLGREDVRGYLGEATVEVVREITRSGAESPDPDDATPCLCHGDFNPTNIIVKDGEVSGILDWEFAHAGSRYMDIGNLLRNTDPKRHVLIERGLEAGGVHLPHDWKRRARLIDLSSHLEFLTTARADDFKQSCVLWIRDFVAEYGSGA